MKKTIDVLLITLLSVTLSGCSVHHEKSTNQPNPSNQKVTRPTTPAYLPVKQLWKNQSKPIQTLVGAKNVHSARFLNGLVVADAPGHGLIVSSPVQNGDPRYPDGLYVLDPRTSSVTPLFHLNPMNHEQVNEAAANDQWLVYEVGTDTDQQTSWSLFAYNWATHKTYKIYSTSDSYDDLGDPSGLYIEGNQCIWSNCVTPKGSSRVISGIHAFDLLHKKDRLLVQMENEPPTLQTTADTKASKYGVIYWASAGGGKVIYSVFNGKDTMDTSPDGDLYEYDLESNQVTHLLHVYHAANPMSSYGDVVVMEDNYQSAPNGPDNPAPYPVYLYKKGEKTVYQLSPDRNAYFPTQNARFVAWAGVDVSTPQLYDLETGTYYTLPGINAHIFGKYVVWRMADALGWAELPD